MQMRTLPCIVVFLTLSRVHVAPALHLTCERAARLRGAQTPNGCGLAGRDGPRWCQRRTRRARHDGQCSAERRRGAPRPPPQQQHNRIKTHNGRICRSLSVLLFFGSALSLSLSVFRLQEDEVREFVRSEMSQHCGESSCGAHC